MLHKQSAHCILDRMWARSLGELLPACAKHIMMCCCRRISVGCSMTCGPLSTSRWQWLSGQLCCRLKTGSSGWRPGRIW